MGIGYHLTAFERSDVRKFGRSPAPGSGRARGHRPPAPGPSWSLIIQLLAAALDVALHELLGVLLQHAVDLVYQLVDVFLDLLAALARLGHWLRRVLGRRALLAPLLP